MSKVVEYLRSLGLKELEVKQPRRYVFEVSPEKLREVIAGVLKVSPQTYVSAISGIDYVGEGVIEVNYLLWVIEDKVMVVIKVRVPRESPKVPTIYDLIPGALNSELEVYDLLGVVFEGNDKLRRGFLTPPEIASQNIFPLRKDFKV